MDDDVRVYAVPPEGATINEVSIEPGVYLAVGRLVMQVSQVPLSRDAVDEAVRLKKLIPLDPLGRPSLSVVPGYAALQRPSNPGPHRRAKNPA